MATCSSLRSLFENPLPENPTLIESLSSWNHHKPMKPIEASSFAEIFGELYFQEKPESPATISPVPTPPPLAAPALAQAPQSNISESDTKNVVAPENPPLDSILGLPKNHYRCNPKGNGGFSTKNSESLQLCTEGLGSESSDDVDNLMDSGDDWRSCGKGELGTGRRQVKYNRVDGYSKCCWDVKLSKSGKEFPPPIPSIGKSGKPWVCLKSYREDGRFVLREIRIPSQELLRASREDGRLKLHFVHPDEDIAEGEGEEEEEEEDDDDDREQDEKGEQEGEGGETKEEDEKKVSLPVVRRFVQAVSEQAVGVGLIRGVRPDQQLVKIVNDELVKLMGGEVSDLVFAKSGPTVILLAGLQGVGKTTVCAKLAFYLKKLGKSCMLVAGDVYRPAAIDQLSILGEQVGVPVYKEGTQVKPAQIAKNGLEEAKKKNIDVVIVDTAGRLQIDKSMMDELKEVKKALNPTEVLLVVDAMTGQEAAALVTTFNIEIGITGAILTKLDGDSRGGAALSVREVSGKPIKLVGRGERMEDLEPFYPDRMAGRILGMGDVLSFVEKAQEVMKQEDAEELQKKIMSAKFDFNDFLKQTRAVAQMGSMSRVIGMIPGMGKVTPAQIREAEKSLKIMESMINVMTTEEREKPELLAESPARRKRISTESGKTEQQVSQLVAQLFQMRVRMKNLLGVMEGGSIPALSNLEESLKAEEKAPPGTARRKRRSESRRQFAESTAARPSPRGFGSKN